MGFTASHSDNILVPESDDSRTNDTKRVFFNIVGNRLITTVFQPIISLRDGSVLGYEALSRGPKQTKFECPKQLLDAAKEYEAATVSQ